MNVKYKMQYPQISLSPHFFYAKIGGMTIKKPIPNNLKYYREKAGYKQAEVAAILSLLKNDEYHKLPNNLKYFREKQGLSLKEVAKKLGIASPKTIEKWENAETVPRNPRHVFLLAQLYETTTSKLYEQMEKAITRDITRAEKELGLK